MARPFSVLTIRGSSRPQRSQSTRSRIAVVMSQFRQTLAVGGLQGCYRGADVELHHTALAAAAHLLTEGGVFDEFQDRLCHSLNVVRTMEESVFTIDNGFTRSIDACCHDGK